MVPAAPALATIREDAEYHGALKDADFAIFDSGFMCLLLRLFKGVNVKKLSGLEFMRQFLLILQDSGETVFTVEASEKDAQLNKNLFKKFGIAIGEAQYIAPIYKPGHITDPQLVEQLQVHRPKYVIINLGGGVQEVLGSSLKKAFNGGYCPVIICTGAAVAFLSGGQGAIPRAVDKIYLGWLARCLADPKRFVPRYLMGFKLIKLLRSARVEKVQ